MLETLAQTGGGFTNFAAGIAVSSIRLYSVSMENGPALTQPAPTTIRQPAKRCCISAQLLRETATYFTTEAAIWQRQLTSSTR